MGWFSSSPPADAAEAGGNGTAAAPAAATPVDTKTATPAPASTTTSTPASSSASSIGSFSAPPSAANTVEESAQKGLSSSYVPGDAMNKYKGKTDYDSANFGQFTSQVHDSDGLDDYKYVEQQKYANTYGDRGWWSNFQASLPPRVRGCMNSIAMGCKMGAAVGGVFGTIMGCYASVVHRNVLLLPVAAIGGACSFGFFLGCGMIIRCEETGEYKRVYTGRGQGFSRSFTVPQVQTTLNFNHFNRGLVMGRSSGLRSRVGQTL